MSSPPGDDRRPGPSFFAGNSQLYVLAWVFYLVLSIAGAVWIGVRDGGISPELFWSAERWWLDLLAGLALAAVMLGAWELVYRFVLSARQLSALLAQILGPLARAEVLALALLSGFGEELFFRGAVQGSLGWLWATVIFGLLHTGPGKAFRIWTVFAVLAGGIFGGVALWRGNLLAPMVAHASFNAVGLWRLSSLAQGVGSHEARG